MRAKIAAATPKHTNMAFAAISIIALFAAATTSAPLKPRAGGPAFIPIPSNCTIINPLPQAACGASKITGWQVSETFNASHHLYAEYFEGFLSRPAQTKQCLEQCYGYGNRGDCKSALLANNVPTPPGYFGTAGGVLEAACLMFDAYLDPDSFSKAPGGQYVAEAAGSIYCPS